MFLFASANSSAQSNAQPSLATTWWKDSVIYEIFVRSFQDSNGDGVGDLRGITQRLDYLQHLGVGAVWLTPIYPSPSYHGYDIVEYRSVQTEFGTLTDFRNLIREAHLRGLKIILDIAVNHTSDQNPWFEHAKKLHAHAMSTSPHDWYLWSAHDPGWTQGLGRWWPLEGLLYYSSFSKHMPDLNWHEPAVMSEVKSILHFWTDLGVDGFRLDAARYYVKGVHGEPDTLGTHGVLREFIQDIKRMAPQTFFVGEIWADASTIATYVNDDQGLDAAFNFPVSFGLQNSLVAEQGTQFGEALGVTLQAVKDPSKESPFLTNHDMIRLASVVKDAGAAGVKKLQLAAVALFTLPGPPVVYYGEEIGLANPLPLSSEDLGKRTPMQWKSSAAFGFTNPTALPWQSFSNASLDKNVEAELADPTSLLASYQKLIFLRKTEVSLRRGNTVALLADREEISVFARSSLKEKETETILVALNFSSQAQRAVSFKINSHLLPESQIHFVDLWGDSVATLKHRKGSPSVSLDQLGPFSGAIIKLIPEAKLP